MDHPSTALNVLSAAASLMARKAGTSRALGRTPVWLAGNQWYHSTHPTLSCHLLSLIPCLTITLVVEPEGTSTIGTGIDHIPSLVSHDLYLIGCKQIVLEFRSVYSPVNL